MLASWLAQGKRENDSEALSSRPEKQGRTGETHYNKSRAEEWVSSPEFSDQMLEVKDEHVFCKACGAQIGNSGVRMLRQHCFGDQAVAARVEFFKKEHAARMKLRHFRKVTGKLEKEKEAAVLLKSIELHRQKMFDVSEKSLLPRSGLHNEEIAARVVVFETLAGAGIPLSKLDDDDFLELIQKDGPKLGGRQGVVEVMPFVLNRQREMISETIAGRLVSLVCDGSKANFLIEGGLIRFVSSAGDIVQACIGLSRIDRSLDGQQLRALVQHHLDSNMIPKSQVVCMTTDSAAINKAMGKHLNWEVRNFEEKARLENSLPLHHCFSHMISNAGAKLRDNLTISAQLLSGLKGLRVSDSAKLLFRDITGASLPVGTDNRWFYWVEYVKAVLPHWRKLPQFVKQCKEAGFMPRKVSKMLFLISTDPGAKNDALRAGLELFFVLQLGTVLASTCYFLEGDGFLSPFAFSRLQMLNDLCVRVANLDYNEENEFIFGMREFAKQSQSTVLPNGADFLIRKVWDCRLVLTNYWRESIWDGMSDDLDLFKGFSVLDPIQACALPKPEIVERLSLLIQKEQIVGQGTNEYRRVTGVKYFNDQVLQGLVAQLEEYLRLARLFEPILSGVPPSDQPAKLWEWWWKLKDETGVSRWSMLAQLAVLHQPSSASIERFFSVIKGATSAQQVREDEETALVRAMLRFNKGKLKKTT